VGRDIVAKEVIVVHQENQLIEEQIQYYRRRAPEYDETSSPPGDPFAAHGKEIEAALRDLAEEFERVDTPVYGVST